MVRGHGSSEQRRRLGRRALPAPDPARGPPVRVAALVFRVTTGHSPRQGVRLRGTFVRPGNRTRWWRLALPGLLGLVLAVVALTGSATASDPNYCGSGDNSVANTCTYSYTGSEDTFTVPHGVHTIHVVAIGATGGAGAANYSGSPLGGSGGYGADVEGD